MPERRNGNGNNVGLVPPAEPAGARYERDFYSWLMEQARHLREGRWAALERENLAEEIESLGREQFNKLESALRVLLLHFLKWDHQPAMRSRSWVLSIEAQRLEVTDILADNPGLQPRIGEALARAYRKARLQAAKETGLETSAFPETCRYAFDDLTSRGFSL
jgi:predicted DNA-binding ribbon-helix-helix protein